MDLDFAGTRGVRFVLVLLASLAAITLSSAALAAPDIDGDGLPDEWELTYGFNPYDATDAALDTDTDGFSNLDEFRTGTDPLDVTSFPPETTTWFESFEDGVPAQWDTSSDATADAWIQSPEHATEGNWSLRSPDFNAESGTGISGMGFPENQISFTRNFAAGVLSADYYIVGRSFGWGRIYVDGVEHYSLPPYGGDGGGQLSVPVSAGIHTITISFVRPFFGSNIYLDNLTFAADGPVDADGDGLPRDWELANGLDPNDPADALLDDDGDGLNNFEEYTAGSSISHADTDGDGLLDGDEVVLGSNVLNADTDADGLTDGWEIDHGLDPLNMLDAGFDNDGDGVSNYNEFRIGTDINDAASVPEVVARWFESFENGIPADWDASSDASADATSDDWTVSDEFATDGVLSLAAPVDGSYDDYGNYGSDQISFTKLYTDGRLSFDVNLVDDGWSSWLHVLVDGNIWFVAYEPQQTQVTLDLPAGVHTVSIRRGRYVYPYYEQRLYVDNVRFISSGDTDGDGLPDTWEFDNGLDPDDAADAQLDGDGDGLSNAQEFAAGTNPGAADSDADGISDGVELDSGTNPLSSDSDNDGLPDSFELANSLDPLDGNDANADADGDGFSNIDEFRVGTDPQNAASAPALTTSWFESFENGLPSDWDASTDASADAANWPWLPSQDFVTDGASSLQSAPVPAGKRTEIYINRYFAEGRLSFDFAVGVGYSNCCDALIVTVDGEERVYGYSGNSGRRFLQLTRGVHEIRFAFVHDFYGYDDGAPRAAWIDNLRFEQGTFELDSDNDGLPDAWEMANGTSWYNPWDAGYDDDGDGLTNLQEFFAGTSIHNADSDGDGLSDAEEVDAIGSDPLDADSDDDGLPDAWEVGNGLDPLNAADASLDSDGDGFSNHQEFLWGTGANDPGEPALQATWFESFEAGFPADWDASGDTSSDASTDASSDAPWELTTRSRSDGIYALRAGVVSHLQNSAVSVSKFLQAGVLFFDYKVSSHPSDTLSLYVNGEQRLKAKYGVMYKRAEVELEGGYEQLKFVFSKNSKHKFADNSAYIDNVEFFAHGSDGDLDGMDDIWEVRNGLDPRDTTDALKDPDRDRINNLQEFRNGTDPRRFNRPPRAVPAPGVAGGDDSGGSSSGNGSNANIGGPEGGATGDAASEGDGLPVGGSGSGGGGAGGLVLLMLGGFACRRVLAHRHLASRN